MSETLREKIAEIIKAMRFSVDTCMRSHDAGDVVGTNQVEEWAGALESLLAATPPNANDNPLVCLVNCTPQRRSWYAAWKNYLLSVQKLKSWGAPSGETSARGEKGGGMRQLRDALSCLAMGKGK